MKNKLLNFKTCFKIKTWFVKKWGGEELCLPRY